MATFIEEKGSQFLSRYTNVLTDYNLEKNLFPSLKPEDIVEIYGESGAGKTELLYHFIARCILPDNWKGLMLDGLNLRVIFIDNDCRFDLLRLITILETRIKLMRQSTCIKSEEMSVFINERLRCLEIIKCFNSEQFLVTLHSLETLLSLENYKTVLMVDGMTSFYWSDKMKYVNHHQNLLKFYTQIATVLKKMSQNCKIPVFATRRKIINNETSDKKILGQTWRNSVKWQLELTFNGSKPDKTVVSLTNVNMSSTCLCAIGKNGFVVHV